MPDGGHFTEADNWEELRRKVKEAVAAYYFDQPKMSSGVVRAAPHVGGPPSFIRLHLVRDEVLANG